MGRWVMDGLGNWLAGWVGCGLTLEWDRIRRFHAGLVFARRIRYWLGTPLLECNGKRRTEIPRELGKAVAIGIAGKGGSHLFAIFWSWDLLLMADLASAELVLGKDTLLLLSVQYEVVYGIRKTCSIMERNDIMYPSTHLICQLGNWKLYRTIAVKRSLELWTGSVCRRTVSLGKSKAQSL